METREIRPGYRITRIIRGGWQLAGGHGDVERNAAIGDLVASAEAGILTFDCADIYTGVEELIGAARRAYADRHGAAALQAVKVHTKFVPDLAHLHEVDRIYVRTIIERSLRRLGMERLDLVQFHWWDYAVPGCLDAARWLEELREEGKIDLIGGTNFDTDHTEKLVASGVELATMQVQYSLLDARPERALVAAARKRDIHLLVYGTVAGGFLGDRWLGQPEPEAPLENRSLTKYKLVIDDFGGWDLFQTLLRALRKVADRHGADIATIASRYMLDLPQVAAVIVGARSREHLFANLKIAAVKLSDADRAEIGAILAQRQGPEGDTFELERDREGRHGRIMKYNLSKVAS
ncbi:aldo/keto reductase [Dongia sp.]|uniref:aldo/keto reductase n=1 Tax=Dongia sp. TaxID=1977262 RepID=UPI0037520FC4